MAWRHRENTVERRAARLAFLAASSAAGARLLWIAPATAAAAIIALVLFVWVLPAVSPAALHLIAGPLHAVAPWFVSGPGTPDIVLGVDLAFAAGIVIAVVGPLLSAVHAVRHRDALARGYAEAEKLVPDVFVGAPSVLPVMLLLTFNGFSLWRDGSLAAMAAVAFVVGVQVACLSLPRLVVAPGGRARLIARMIVCSLRSLRTVMGMVALLLFVGAGALAYLDASSDRREAARLTPEWKSLAANPRLAAADAAVANLYADAVRTTVATTDMPIPRSHGDLPDAYLNTAMDDDFRTQARITAVAAFWAGVAARTSTEAELRQRCDADERGYPCHVTEFGRVDGSERQMIFRLTAPQRFAMDQQLVPISPPHDAAEVYGPVDGGWRLLVHATSDATPGPPRMVHPPAGPLLLFPHHDDFDGKRVALYASDATGWHLVDQRHWLRQVDAVLPRHTCLLHAGEGARVVFDSISPDFGAMTAAALLVQARNSPDWMAMERMDIQFGIEAERLVVRGSRTERFAGWRWTFGRLLAGPKRC